MSVSSIIKALMAGATICRGSFSGYWLVRSSGKKTRVTDSIVESMEKTGIIQRIDDRSSVVGAEWSLKKEKA